MGRKAERRSGGGADATRAASAKVISVDQATTAWPSSSMPRRPARPVSWRYSPEVSVARPAPAVLGEALDHHRPCRHVDAERQRLGGEDHLQQPGREALLDRLAEQRHQAGVVGCHARLQALEPFVVSEHAQVLVAERLDPALGDLADGGPFLRVGQPDAVAQDLAHGVVAGGAAEDEDDGGQHLAPPEILDHLGAQGGPIGQAGPPPPGLPVDRPSLQRPADGLVDPEPFAARPTVVEEQRERRVSVVLPPVTAKWWRSTTGVGARRSRRCRPAPSVSQPPNSSALFTVADRHTKRTSGGDRTSTSSQTAPR